MSKVNYILREVTDKSLEREFIEFPKRFVIDLLTKNIWIVIILGVIFFMINISIAKLKEQKQAMVDQLK